MKLFTINATPVRVDVSEYDNTVRVNHYPSYVASILKHYDIDGFTIYQVQGYWQGESEVSFKIELALEQGQSTIDKVGKICADLRDQYNQDAVMLTYPNNSVEFI
jgi:hypothetical protein